MTAEPVTVQPPAHPIHALTTYELSRYRRELEHALKELREHAPSANFSRPSSPRS